MALTGSFTTAFQNKLLDALASNDVLDTCLDGLKLGLYTSDPGEDGTSGTEVSGGNYSRQSFTVGAATEDTSVTPSVGKISNAAAINFAANGAAWNGIEYAAIFRTKSLTRSIVGITNASEVNASGDSVSYNKIIIPASHCSTVATLTITGFDVVDRAGGDGVADWHSTLTYSGSNATYYTEESNGAAANSAQNSTNFIRVKTGPLAGICYDIVGEGTNTITIDSYYKFLDEDILNQQVEVMAKVTLADLSGIVHNSSTTLDSNGYAASGSGFLSGSSSTADRFYIHNTLQTAVVYYLQNAPVFAGDVGWRQLGVAASADAGGAVIPPAELWPHTDQTTDDYCMLDTRQTADWTLTSQVSTTDELVARLRAVDGSGNNATLNVADGSSLEISAGDLKLTLS